MSAESLWGQDHRRQDMGLRKQGNILIFLAKIPINGRDTLSF